MSTDTTEIQTTKSKKLTNSGTGRLLPSLHFQDYLKLKDSLGMWCFFNLSLTSDLSW